MALPEIIAGMDALRRDNPWPELPEGVEPFYLSLDAGGRHLVIDVIRERGITLMLEIGCFLCGSTRQWLDSSPDLEVIGVDPWDLNWSNYVHENGRFRMREHVERFADEKGFTIEAEGATWLLANGRPPTPTSWDADAAGALVKEIDSRARALLRVVATAVPNGESVTFDEAGRQLGLGANELLLATQRLNEASASAGRPQAIGLGGSDSDGWRSMHFVLADGLAPLLAPHL